MGTDGELVGKRVRITYPRVRGPSGVFEGTVAAINAERIAVKSVVMIPPRGMRTPAVDQSFWRADVEVEEINAI